MSLDNTTILKIMADKLHHNNFQLQKYVFQPFDANGMMGELIKIICTVQENSMSISKDHTFFVKKKPPHLRSACVELYHGVFYKEVATFRMLKSINLPTLNTAYPKCFYSDDQNMVLEDLLVDGYKCLTSDRVATEDELRIVLSTLAGMHAAMIAHEEQQTAMSPDQKPFRLNDKFPEAFVEIHMDLRIIEMQLYVKSMMKGLETAIKVFDLPEVLKTGKRLKDELVRIVDFLYSKMGYQPSTKYRNVMCHCDLWPANIFMKYNEDGKPQQAKIIDYQLVKYLPPACDVLFYILLNTTRDFRQKNILELKKIYYDFFCKYLEQYGVDALDIYTYDQFLDSFKEIEFLCILCEINTIPMVYNCEQTAHDLVHSDRHLSIILEDRSPLFTDFTNNKYFMDRIRDCLLDMVEYFENN